MHLDRAVEITNGAEVLTGVDALRGSVAQVLRHDSPCSCSLRAATSF
jgi:hypothetical protein